MNSWVEKYLDHLDTVVNGEARFYRASPPEEIPPTTVISYPTSLNNGLQISFTAGLSSANHPAWKFGRPELVIAMKSEDVRWGWAIGDVAYKLQGNCTFCYGDIIRFGTQISEESEMSAFVIFAPSFGFKEQFEIEFDDRKINIAQMYPIYEGEIDLIESSGLKEFLQRPKEFFEDPSRIDLSS